MRAGDEDGHAASSQRRDARRTRGRAAGLKLALRFSNDTGRCPGVRPPQQELPHRAVCGQADRGAQGLFGGVAAGVTLKLAQLADRLLPDGVRSEEELLLRNADAAIAAAELARTQAPQDAASQFARKVAR